MMLVAGIDIGSLTAKALILEDSKIRAYAIIPTGVDSEETSKKVMNSALERAELSLEDLEYVVSTGYGRVIVPFANKNITEISCHAKGAVFLFPSVRTILDMGGQDCKAIRCDASGKVQNFAMNDKCAAGTGRFFEIIAETMELPLEELGGLSLEAMSAAKISSACVVFAKSEVLALLRKGVDKKNILAGINEAVALRVFALLNRVGIEKDFAITGGIAKNVGVVRKVEEKVGLKALIAEEPQIVGALGAALFAKEALEQV
ncbi:MAG: Activator of 2-hydroxyglutaryl-CoA dehydratase [Candidatus Alkanophagales archaeon MCA70_species_2]|nr:Activator of 2-hydroxyglutaryl-CoA dehydratase [Candidatus Alkanophaga liquidiphilum]